MRLYYGVINIFHMFNYPRFSPHVKEPRGRGENSPRGKFAISRESDIRYL